MADESFMQKKFAMGWNIEGNLQISSFMSITDVVDQGKRRRYENWVDHRKTWIQDSTASFYPWIKQRPSKFISACAILMADCCGANFSYSCYISVHCYCRNWNACYACVL